MKIAKDRLKQIIKEELEIGQTPPETGGAFGTKDPDGYEGRMAKSNLYKIKEYATNMCDMLEDGQNLEPWVQEKIAVAAYIMDSVGHYMEYEYMRSHGGEEGGDVEGGLEISLDQTGGGMEMPDEEGGEEEYEMGDEEEFGGGEEEYSDEEEPVDGGEEEEYSDEEGEEQEEELEESSAAPTGYNPKAQMNIEGIKKMILSSQIADKRGAYREVLMHLKETGRKTISGQELADVLGFDQDSAPDAYGKGKY
jgi:hypothetical protein